MINFLLVAIKFIILLGLLVFIHEGGHFIVAKLCKVKVHDFSIGFGPIIFEKRFGETNYELRAIPLGGYVKMEGEEEASDDEGSFSKKSIPKRIAIVLAGATVNIVFGLVVYFILMSSTGNYISNKVSTVEDGYGAKVSGILPADEIVKMNNKFIHVRYDFEKAMDESKGDKVKVEIKRGNEYINLEVLPTEESTKNTGVYFGAAGDKLTAQIKSIYPNSPAEIAGLKAKDIIIKVNGIDTQNNPYKVIDLTGKAEGKDIVYTITRQGQEQEITVTPNIISKYYLGVELAKADNNFFTSIYYGFWDTVDFSGSILENLKKLFTGNIRTDQLMGPIGISTMVADTNGFVDFIYLLALISLSLGITNLLPIPPLDGWKVVLYLIEAIRRKPMNINTQMKIEALGFAFMIVLSIYVAYNDILRI